MERRTLSNMPTKSFIPSKVDSIVGPKHNESLYKQKRSLGQCFKCGDKFVWHQCNVKGIDMIKGLEEEIDELLELTERESNEI